MGGHHFISYSRPEASDFVTVLCDEIEALSPDFRVWFDQRDGRPEKDWTNRSPKPSGPARVSYS